MTAGDQAPIAIGFEVTRDGRVFVCCGARSAGRAVHAGWTFTVDGGTLETSAFEGCTGVFPGDGDEVTVHASADGLTTAVTLPIVETSSKRHRGLARTLLRSAGERATR